MSIKPGPNIVHISTLLGAITLAFSTSASLTTSSCKTDTIKPYYTDSHQQTCLSLEILHLNVKQQLAADKFEAIVSHLNIRLILK